MHLLGAYPEGQAALLCVAEAHLQALVELRALEERLKFVESGHVPSLEHQSTSLAFYQKYNSLLEAKRIARKTDCTPVLHGAPGSHADPLKSAPDSPSHW